MAAGGHSISVLMNGMRGGTGRRGEVKKSGVAVQGMPASE